MSEKHLDSAFLGISLLFIHILNKRLCGLIKISKLDQKATPDLTAQVL
jgi:hypothetical protein